MSRKNLTLVLPSVFLTLLAAEALLRFNPPVAVYIQTRNIVQHTHSEVSRYPLTGYIPRAGLVKKFQNYEFNTTVKINSMNMRGREYALEKPPGTKRIAVMGDSFVFGWGVENHETVTEALERELPGTEVLNFGVSGYAAWQELERLKSEALRFQPDIVLFFLYGLPEAVPENFNERYELIGGTLFRSDIVQLPLKRKVTRFLEKNIYLFCLFQEARGVIQEWMSGVEPENYGDQEAETKKGLELLSELKKIGEREKFIPAVVFVPIKQDAKTGNSSQAESVRAFCKSQGIAFLDLTGPLYEYWNRENKSPYFRIDDHWNRDGHLAAARAAAAFLKSQEGIS